MVFIWLVNYFLVELDREGNFTTNNTIYSIAKFETFNECHRDLFSNKKLETSSQRTKCGDLYIVNIVPLHYCIDKTIITTKELFIFLEGLTTTKLKKEENEKSTEY